MSEAACALRAWLQSEHGGRTSTTDLGKFYLNDGQAHKAAISKKLKKFCKLHPTILRYNDTNPPTVSAVSGPPSREKKRTQQQEQKQEEKEHIKPPQQRMRPSTAKLRRTETPVSSDAVDQLRRPPSRLSIPPAPRRLASTPARDQTRSAFQNTFPSSALSTRCKGSTTSRL